MKTPAFWYTSPGVLSSLLSPLGWCYGKGGQLLRAFSKAEKFSRPLISIGGLTCGGAGKTPVALAIAHILQDKGHVVHFVTRGYKGKMRGPVRVNPSFHNHEDVGDEPLLLAGYAPTWVSKNRRWGVREAITNKADIIILDDAHQTRGLLKTLSFVVIDCDQGVGNAALIPAGPLRETLHDGLDRADRVIALGEGAFSPSVPFFRASRIPDLPKRSFDRVVAFCGLGFPQKFYETLKDMRYCLVATKSFPDHYRYQEKDLLSLQRLADEERATLVTTRKDWVRLSPFWQEKIQTIDIKIVFQEEELVYRFILEKIFPSEGGIPTEMAT